MTRIKVPDPVTLTQAVVQLRAKGLFDGANQIQDWINTGYLFRDTRHWEEKED